jgi:hypothetical protein
MSRQHTVAEQLNKELAKIGNNWSSGHDEQFGGRFVCVHGLSQDEADALIAAGKTAHAALKTAGGE